MSPAVLLAVVAVAAGADAPGAADDALRERVQALLGAVDEPATDAQWRALGPGAVPLLEAAVAGEPLPSRRAAAVAGLAAIGGDRARAAVLAAIGDERQPRSVRAGAIRGAARVVAPPELTATLAPVLRGARSPRLRAVAAEVLARDGGAAGCAAVREASAGPPRTGPRFTAAVAECDRKARRP